MKLLYLHMRQIRFFSIAFMGLIFLSSFSIKNEALKWYDWNEGYPLAIKKKKIILIDAYTDWCGWCKKMDRDTYTHEKVIKKLNEHFILVKFNPELSDRKYLVDTVTYSAAEFYQQINRGEQNGFPTTYFINPAKKSLMMQPGYLGPETFIEVLDKVIEEASH